MLKWLTVFCLCVAPALAGGRGGHLTTFDANLFGGPANVSCIASGSQAGVCNTGYSATCNGIADDSAAFSNWLTDHKGSAAQTVLYIAPGKKCHVTAGPSITWDGIGRSLNYVQNAVVWGYGASADFTHMGGDAMPLSSGYNACDFSARINTVSAGSTTITLSTGNMVSGVTATGVFTPGTWVVIGGPELQNAPSYPSNFQFFEYAIVTAVSGNILTLGSPLNYSYESTWPLVSDLCAGGNDGGGPATVYVMGPAWNQNFKLLGLTSINTTTNPTAIQGKEIYLLDSVFPSITANFTGAFPTGSLNWWAINSQFSQSEIDKEIWNLNFINSSWYVGWVVQSASVNTHNVVSSTMAQTNSSALSTKIVNSNLGITHLCGPNPYGVGSSIVLDGVTISAVGYQCIPTSLNLSFPSYSNGVFSIANVAPALQYQEFIWTFVPGGTYTFVFGNGPYAACSPNYVFKVTDLTKDGTNTNATTGTWTQDGSSIAAPASLPSLTNACGGSSATRIATFGYKAITQINRPAGTPDITTDHFSLAPY